MEVLTWLFRGKAQVADLPPDWRLSSRCPVHVIITTLSKILKMILGKNYWCADSPGLHVCKSAVCKSASLQVCRSASLQVCKSASLQVCKSASLQVCKSASLQSASVAHRVRINY